MYKKQKALFTLLSFLISSTLVFGATEQQKFTSLIQSEIKRNFNEYQEIRETAPEAKEPFINADKYQSLYTKEFIMTTIVDNDFGGIWAVIGFLENKSSFQLWLYEINKDEWELRFIEKM